VFGKLIAFATRRVTARAVDAIERQVVWTLVGGALLSAAGVFLMISLFWLISSELGPLAAAVILAGVCAVSGLIAFRVPGTIEEIEHHHEDDEPTTEKIAETVDEEAHAAVDYMGPLQVVASAFLLGVTAARTVRARSS
jgi:cobalamin biosynthesis protein CobD/CbiB